MSAPDAERSVRPLADPRELEQLAADELVQRVRPLLYRGGLTRPPERWRRIEPNIPAACAELAAEWRRSPLLSGRKVGFGEYLACRLVAKLRQLDAEQHPELFDGHRRYTPASAPALIGLSPLAAVPAAAAAPLPAPEPRSWQEALAQTLSTHRIAAASQAALLGALARVASGQIRSPYQLARALGLSAAEAKSHPATGAFLSAQELLRGYGPVPSATGLSG